MIEASTALEFERAALLRDQIHELQASQQPAKGGKGQAKKAGRQSVAPAKGRRPAAKTAGRKKAQAKPSARAARR